MILNLSEADIAKVLRYEQLIPAMEKALAAFSAGEVIQPMRNMLAVAESITRTRSPPLPSRVSCSAACCALCTVPEIPPLMWIDTTSSPASSSGSHTERKSPIDGCEVVAPLSEARRRS